MTRFRIWSFASGRWTRFGLAVPAALVSLSVLGLGLLMVGLDRAEPERSASQTTARYALVDLGPCEPLAINNQGVILARQADRLLLWRQDQWEELRTEGAQRLGAAPGALNHNGELVFTVITAEGAQRHYLLAGQTILELAWPETLAVLALNDRGELAHQTVEGLAISGRMLPTLGGQQATILSLNHLGQAAGQSQTPDGQSHATLWWEGEALDLSPPDTILSLATSVSDRGTVWLGSLRTLTVDAKHSSGHLSWAPSRCPT